MVEETRPDERFAPAAPPPPVADQFGFGYPQAAPPVQPQSYPQAYPAPYLPPAPSRRLPTAAIVAIVCAAGGVIVLILAAVAIPVFLNQRDKATAAATTVSLPPAIGELSQAPMTPDLQGEAEALRNSVSVGMPDPKVAVFTDATGAHGLVVMGGKLSTVLHQKDEAEVVRGFWRGAQQELAGQAVLGVPAERSPGELGGIVSCASFNPSGVTGEICIAVDPGSMLVTIDVLQGEGGASDPTLATTVREAVVHRR
jgi:hypothetical protein